MKGKIDAPEKSRRKRGLFLTCRKDEAALATMFRTEFSITRLVEIRKNGLFFNGIITAQCNREMETRPAQCNSVGGGLSGCRASGMNNTDIFEPTQVGVA